MSAGDLIPAGSRRKKCGRGGARGAGPRDPGRALRLDGAGRGGLQCPLPDRYGRGGGGARMPPASPCYRRPAKSWAFPRAPTHRVLKVARTLADLDGVEAGRPHSSRRSCFPIDWQASGWPRRPEAGPAGLCFQRKALTSGASSSRKLLQRPRSELAGPGAFR